MSKTPDFAGVWRFLALNNSSVTIYAAKWKVAEKLFWSFATHSSHFPSNHFPSNQATKYSLSLKSESAFQATKYSPSLKSESAFQATKQPLTKQPSNHLPSNHSPSNQATTHQATTHQATTHQATTYQNQKINITKHYHLFEVHHLPTIVNK